MAVNNKAYHVSMDGKGYILQDETYAVESQEHFNPRFSTGDPSTGDLSFWQFLAQEDFSGGRGQLDFSDTSKYKDSFGWDFRGGNARVQQYTRALTQNDSWPSVSQVDVPQLYDNFALYAEGAFDSTKWTEEAGHNYEILTGKLHNSTVGARGTFDKYIEAPQTNANGSWQITVGCANGAAWAGTDWLEWDFIRDGSGNRYTLQLTSTAGINLDRNGVQIATTTAPGTLTSGSGTLRTISIDRDGANTFRIYVDGILTLTHTDATYTASTVMRLRLSELLTPSNEGAYVGAVWIPLGVSLEGLIARPKTLIWNGRVYCCYPSDQTLGTLTDIVPEDPAQSIPNVKHVDSRDMAIVHRDSDIANEASFLAMTNGTNLVTFIAPDGTGGSSLNPGFPVQCIVPLSSTSILLAGTEQNYSGYLRLQRIVYNAGAWTAADTDNFHALSTVTGGFINSFAFDGDGTLYLVGIDIRSTAGRSTAILFRINSTDLAATNLTVTESRNLTDFLPRNIFGVGGNVYLAGVRFRGTKAYDSIIRYPDTVMWESEVGTDISGMSVGEALNLGMADLFDQGSGNFLISGSSQIDGRFHDIIQFTPAEKSLNVGIFEGDKDASDAPYMSAIADYLGNTFFFDITNDTTQVSGFEYRGVAAATSDLKLRFSSFGANTPLIQKSLFKANLELSEPLPVDTTMSVYVNDVFIGTMSSADGTLKELTVPSEITGVSFSPELRIQKVTSWEGYVQRFTLQYIPVQLKKKSWSFTVKAENALRLLNSQVERRTSQEIFSDLENLYLQKNVPFTFKDTRGQEFEVIMTKFRSRQPITNDEQDRREYLCTVELLEV